MVYGIYCTRDVLCQLLLTVASDEEAYCGVSLFGVGSCQVRKSTLHFTQWITLNWYWILQISKKCFILRNTTLRFNTMGNEKWYTLLVFGKENSKKQIKTGDPKEDITSRYVYANGELSKTKYREILQRTSLR